MNRMRAIVVVSLCLFPLSAWAAPVGSAYYTAVNADGPKVYYGFDEASGTTAADLSPNGRNGTYANTYTLGQTSALPGLGKAVLFNGGNVAVPSLGGSFPAFTMEYWLQPTNNLGAWKTVYNRDGWSTGWVHNQLNGGNELSLNGNNPTDGFPAGPIQLNTWQHVALVYDSAAKKVTQYINGRPQTPTTLTTAIAADFAGAGHIGQWNGNERSYLGTMDEFAVYDKPLGPFQVLGHYLAASGLTAPLSYENTVRADAPKLFYRFNEAPGSGTVADSSGNAKNGTPSNVAFGQTGGQAGLGTAALFNNSNSNVVAPALGAMSKLSIETWLRPTTISSDFDTIFNVRNWTTGAVHYQLRQNQLEFSLYNEPDLFFGSAANFPLNAWTHVVTTYDQATGQVKVYVNGFLLDTKTYASPLPVNLQAADIGAWGGNGRAFDGQIDELSIYDYVLSADQVSLHYLASVNQFDQAVVPEPATMALLASSLCMLGRYARRRRS